jgi:hypothetical protein
MLTGTLLLTIVSYTHGMWLRAQIHDSVFLLNKEYTTPTHHFVVLRAR